MNIKNSYNSLIKSSSLFEKINNIENKVESLFLLAKFYFALGNLSKIEEIINECRIIEGNNHLSIKYENYIKYIKLVSFNDYYIDKTKEQIKNICDVFIKFNDDYNFAKTYLLLAEKLVIYEMFDEAVVVINDTNLIDACRSKSILEAERLYILGKISSNNKSIVEESSIDLYKRSLNLIKDENITELTWKILLKIAEYYSNRGNL